MSNLYLIALEMQYGPYRTGETVSVAVEADSWKEALGKLSPTLVTMNDGRTFVDYLTRGDKVVKNPEIANITTDNGKTIAVLPDGQRVPLEEFEK